MNIEDDKCLFKMLDVLETQLLMSGGIGNYTAKIAELQKVVDDWERLVLLKERVEKLAIRSRK